MQKLGITHIYDLRSKPELQRNRDAGRGDVVEWDGCKRVFVPVFRDEDYSPEGLAVRLRDYASNDGEVIIPLCSVEEWTHELTID